MTRREFPRSRRGQAGGRACAGQHQLLPGRCRAESVGRRGRRTHRRSL